MGTFFYLSVCLLIPFMCHIPASKAYYSTSSFTWAPFYIQFLPQKNFISRYGVNELFSDNFAKVFFFSVISLSFIIFVTVLKLHSCCFVHTNANPILYPSSFNSIVQLRTFILRLFCHSHHCRNRASISKHTIRYQYYTTCPLHFPLLLSLSSSISANPLAVKFSLHINFLQNLLW